MIACMFFDIAGIWVPVSATNLVFNLVAIPGGVWRYAQEKRVDWQLAWVITAGTLPGLLAGWWVRLHWLREPHIFKLFVGVLSLCLAMRLLWPRRIPVIAGRHSAVGGIRKLPILVAALVIGVIGGAYGIGGGSIMAPVLLVVFGLQLHAVAGAALFGTLVTSAVGVTVYQFLPAPPGIEARPDWALGILFGLGGAAGMYVGARTQRYVPHRALEIGMGAVLAMVLAISATARFPLASRSAMMPEPITVAARRREPSPSASSRRFMA
jgi:uncharacterized protein